MNVEPKKSYYISHEKRNVTGYMFLDHTGAILVYLVNAAAGHMTEVRFYFAEDEADINRKCSRVRKGEDRIGGNGG